MPYSATCRIKLLSFCAENCALSSLSAVVVSVDVSRSSRLEVKLSEFHAGASKANLKRLDNNNVRCKH